MTISSTVGPVPTPVSAATPAAVVAPPRDIFAVTRALGELDAAIGTAEQATRIEVPGKGLFGGGRDAHEAAVSKRRELLEPASSAVQAAVDVLNANGGYRRQPGGIWGEEGGYRVPFFPLGDNAEPIERIMSVAAKHPVKHKWANDMPWQSHPVTTLEQMVELATEAAGEITRGEARINLQRVTDLTSAMLYEQRVDQLDVPQLTRLDEAVRAVRSLGDSRFADDALRGALAVLPERVLEDGRLTTDPTSLAALEQLHRTTVVDAGSTRASTSVAAQLERAAQLAASGDTAGAREVYEALAAASPVA